MTFEYAKVDREGPLTVFTLNRPELMNAIHLPMDLELQRVFDEFANDPDQWIAIVTGAGDRAFSAGKSKMARRMASAVHLPVVLPD